MPKSIPQIRYSWLMWLWFDSCCIVVMQHAAQIVSTFLPSEWESIYLYLSIYLLVCKETSLEGFK